MNAAATRANEQAHVLVVDDDSDFCELLTLRLEHHGYRVSTASNSSQCLGIVGQGMVDAMVLDLMLGSENGLDILSAVQQRNLEIPVVMLTAHGTIHTAVEAMKRGAYGFLTKPFLDHELLQKLAHAVESSSLRREVAGLRRLVAGADNSSAILGVSQAISKVRERIARVAVSDATVLILGESGTGKELAARSIHQMSPRKNGPFIAINCGALPPDLLESELFGHVRGAFTGAVKDKPGLFSAAGGGTLFLDEIGEAPHSVQIKLLRVLQERRYTRVGSTTEQDADVRVVAATNRDLKSEVAKGRFREDLFYRLHVVPINMPPLRDRLEDLPLLAEVFLERAAARHKVRPAKLASDAMTLLLEHDWPGNIRELANVIEGAVVLSAGADIYASTLLSLLAIDTPSNESLGEDIGRVSSVERVGGVGQPIVLPQEINESLRLVFEQSENLPTLKEAREFFDKAYLQEILTRNNTNVAAAARAAGRNRTDFYELLRRYGLNPNVTKDKV